MDEKELINGLKHREHQAGIYMLAQFKEQVFACCYAMGLNHADAEDAAGETFLAVWQGIDKFKGQSKLGTWILKIAYNKSVDHMRRKYKETVLDGTIEIAAVQDDDSVELNEIQESIWSAVMKLPPKLALTTVLFYRQDKSIADISVIMDLPENTVKVNLHRARTKLKKGLRTYVERDENENRTAIR